MAECTIVLDGDFDDHESAAILSRVARLAPSRAAQLPRGATADRLAALADVVEEARGPVLLLDGRYSGHDSPLIDVLGDPRETSTVLMGLQGVAWPANVVAGVVRSAGSRVHRVKAPTAQVGGALRITLEDRSAAARGLREMAAVAADKGWVFDELLPAALVAMTRSGLRVHGVPVGDFIAVVPENRQKRPQVADRLLEADEHRIRLAGAAREADGFYSTFVVRRLSRRATAMALRLHVTPNQVTLASLGIAALAMGAFALGSRQWLIVGAALLQLSLIVDCVDGEVARYTRLHSSLGAWLDAGTDRVKEFGIYAAMAIGASRGGDPLWLLAGGVLALQASRHFVDFGFAVRQADRNRAATAPIQLPLHVLHDDHHQADPTAAQGIAARLGRSATALSDRTNQVGALIWLKRAVIMPIGERWLVISLATAFVGPRLALTLLLVLGFGAALYTTTGRLLRSAVSSAGSRRAAAELTALSDLGVLSGLLPETRFTGRLSWLMPAVSRALEYGVALMACAFVAPALLPLAFCYVFTLTLWHYDTVYRVRFIGQAPPLRARRLALGAPARSALVLSAALAGVGALAGTLAGVGLLVLTVTLADSAVAWSRWLGANASGFSVPRFDVVSAR